MLAAPSVRTSQRLDPLGPAHVSSFSQVSFAHKSPGHNTHCIRVFYQNVLSRASQVNVLNEHKPSHLFLSTLWHGALCISTTPACPVQCTAMWLGLLCPVCACTCLHHVIMPCTFCHTDWICAGVAVGVAVSVLSQLKQFLPKMEQANAELQQKLQVRLLTSATTGLEGSSNKDICSYRCSMHWQQQVQC